MILDYGIRLCIPYGEQNKQWPQIIAATYTAMGMFNSVALTTWTAPSTPILISKDSNYGQLTMSEVSNLAMFPFISTGVASLIMAKLMDYVGRQKTMLVAAVLQSVSWILIIMAPNLLVLYLSRFISGIADAATFTTIPTYLAEMSEPKVRSYYAPLLTINIFLGQFLINFLGTYFDIATAAAIFLCFPVLQTFLLTNLPESPYFLCATDKLASARIALQKLRWTENVEQELTEIELAVKEQIAEPAQFKDLFTISANRYALMVCAGLRGVAQFSGLTAFMVYTQYLFALSGSDWSPATSSIIYFGLFLVVTTAFLPLTQKFGRKPLLTVSCGGCFLALTLVSIYLYIHEHTTIDTRSFNWLPLLGMLLFILFCSVGITTVPNVMMGELFSASIKYKALGVLCIIFTIYSIVVVKLFQILTDNFGMYLPFAGFAVSCFLGSIFSHWILPETKDKSLNQILQEINGKVA